MNKTKQTPPKSKKTTGVPDFTGIARMSGKQWFVAGKIHIPYNLSKSQIKSTITKCGSKQHPKRVTEKSKL